MFIHVRPIVSFSPRIAAATCGLNSLRSSRFDSTAFNDVTEPSTLARRTALCVHISVGKGRKKMP